MSIEKNDVNAIYEPVLIRFELKTEDMHGIS